MLLLAVHLSVFAQKKDKVLFKINNEPTYVSEFNKLFKTNNATLSTNTFEEDLQLMVDYKLKLNQAKIEQIDTLPSIIQEFNKYKNNTIDAFTTDDETLEDLVKEAYQRTINQVKASHLLIEIEDNDTLSAYKKIEAIQKQLKKGANFEELAVKYSDDKSVTKNKGKLGVFTAFKMVYPFECAAYNTPVGEVSEIVKTQFGYHLIKVEEKTKAEPKIKVAHIMITGLGKKKKERIDTIYKKLLSGKKFEDLARIFSDDKGTARKGGMIKPFGRGSLPKSFEDVAFSLTEEKTFSEPFTTPYGWHIVYYRGTEKIKSFKDLKKHLKRKVMNDLRKEKIEDAAYTKMEAKHNVNTNKEALTVFDTENPHQLSDDKLTGVLLSIDNENYLQKDFANYVKSISEKNKKPLSMYKDYKRKKLKEYVIEHLEEEDEELKEILTTYKNGLVIFELMKQNVWGVATKEKEKVKHYYLENKATYAERGDSFEKVKGYVESDYQEKIQNEWLSNLRKNNKVKFLKKQIKKLKKTYK